MADIRTSSLEEPVDVAHYLFTRLQQVGVRGVHGVPGDYNLVALDYVPKCGLTWVGNANELNAGYAADGYARVKGISALVTTFGVGELSALNAIAGCYSEYVPVVHIVGTPSTLSQRDHQMLHHTLGNGSFSVFMDMSRNISQVTENLIDPSRIADQIDHAITQSWIQSRPVYLTLPTDMVQKKVEGSRLKTNLDLAYPPNDPEAEDYAVETILKYLTAARKPVIVVDACAIRHRALDETRAFVTASNLPTFVAPMGKGAIDETLPNFGGVYAGDGSRPAVRDMVSESDLVISIGSIKSDFNTAGFTYRTSTLNTIELHSNRIKVRFSEYPNVRMNGVLKKLTSALGSGKAKLTVMESPAASTNTVPSEEGSAPAGSEITHAWFWPRMGQWLKDGDVVVTETGTANFGIWETRFPPNVTALSQVLWGSIGWSVGALQGAALAAKEAYGDSRRVILFVGDGSLELTVQEISTCIRHGLKPIIFVICNHGYTIERHIHGMEANYNDIQEWDYKNLLKVFNAPQDGSKSHVVKTKGELDALFGDEGFSAAPYIQLVELHMPMEDAPLALKLTAEASAKNNAKEN